MVKLNNVTQVGIIGCGWLTGYQVEFASTLLPTVASIVGISPRRATRSGRDCT